MAQPSLLRRPEMYGRYRPRAPIPWSWPPWAGAQDGASLGGPASPPGLDCPRQPLLRPGGGCPAHIPLRLCMPVDPSRTPPESPGGTRRRQALQVEKLGLAAFGSDALNRDWSGGLQLPAVRQSPGVRNQVPDDGKKRLSAFFVLKLAVHPAQSAPVSFPAGTADGVPSLCLARSTSPLVPSSFTEDPFGVLVNIPFSLLACAAPSGLAQPEYRWAAAPAPVRVLLWPPWPLPAWVCPHIRGGSSYPVRVRLPPPIPRFWPSLVSSGSRAHSVVC